MANDNEKYVIYGGPDPENIGDGCRSVGELFLKQLMLHGERVALVDGVTSDEYTYLEIRSRAIQLARTLQAAGIRKNDVISIVSENRIEMPVVMIATFMCGATVAPINLTYSDREFDHAFNLSRPKILFTSPYAADKVVQVGKQNSKFVEKIILFGDENPFGSDVVLLNDFLAATPKASKFDSFYCEPVDVHNTNALILCSSGTTGLPKGVMLTQYNLMVSAAHYMNSNLKEEIPLDELCILGLVPWFHAFGCITLINVLMVAVKVVFIPKFEEGLFLSCIENYQINCIFMVPPLMVFLAKHPLVANYDLSSLQLLLVGAAPLSKEVEDAVKTRLPHVKTIIQGYGMSEMTLSVLSQQPGLTKKPGSVGVVARGMYVKVIDPDTGKILGPNQRGELCFKGTQIMRGYIGNEKETKNTIDAEGFLHTGDIGYFDEDLQFFIVDRLKELIKYKAYQVPPAELEAIILENPKVKDTAVIGLPDEKSGELPLAYVVKQDDVDVTAKEIIDWVAARTSPAKRLYGGVRFIDAIPKNVSGKILRKDLRALLQQEQPKSKL